MNEITAYIGKQVRYEYWNKGQRHAVSGHLKTVQEDRIKIGDMWLPITDKYTIAELEFTGF